MLLHTIISHQVAGKPAHPPEVQPIRVYAALALNFPFGRGLEFQGRGLELQGRGLELQCQGLDLQGQRLELQGRGLDLQGRGLDLQGRGLGLQLEVWTSRVEV